MGVITFPRAIVNALLSHVQRGGSNEVCGLVSSYAAIPKRCYPIANVADEPQRRYVMDPAAQIKAMRQMRDNGEELMAIYHSHPTTSAKPSVFDVAQANYPSVLYLIISTETNGVLEMRGFRIHGGEVVEERVAME